MSAKFYSPSNRGFYVEDMRGMYEAAGTWPGDLVEVDDETETAIRDAVTRGDNVEIKAGKPVFTPPPAEATTAALARALVDIRKQRVPIMATLDGIAGRTSRAGDTVTAAAADAALGALLDITKLPALLSATTYDEMRAAVKARYKEIVTGAPAVVKLAFVEAAAS